MHIKKWWRWTVICKIVPNFAIFALSRDLKGS